MKKKAAFFDRDNTLIIDKVYLNDPEQIVYLPHVFEALWDIQNAGYEIIVVTNQSGIPKGIVQMNNLHEIHRRIRAEFSRHGVNIKGFYFAQFSSSSNHPLRKPNPGMLHEAAKDHDINLLESWMVGDKMSDVEAGHRAGAQSILLKVDEEPTVLQKKFYVANNLLEVRDHILT